MSIAITGATGQLGRLTLKSLAARAPLADVVALVRSPEKAADLGVAVRPADYDQPDTLRAALADVETLLLISSNEVGKRLAQHRRVIDAAREVGVKRVVYTSLLHADSSPLDLAVEHRATEQYLKKSGLAYTILRNGWYTENYAGSIAAALGHGEFLGSAGDGRISSATRADYAEAAAVVLTGAGHEGESYELAGDKSWTLADLAEELSSQTRHGVTYKDVPEAKYAAALTRAGLPEALALAIAGWDAAAAQDALFDDGRQLSTLIGRPTTSLRVAVSDALASARRQAA